VNPEILLGYGHASLVESLRPDVSHPTRKIRRATKVIATITAKPCDCPDDHVEVWVRPVKT
jgi:hypothetical protein